MKDKALNKLIELGWRHEPCSETEVIGEMFCFDDENRHIEIFLQDSDGVFYIYTEEQHGGVSVLTREEIELLINVHDEFTYGWNTQHPLFRLGWSGFAEKNRAKRYNKEDVCTEEHIKIDKTNQCVLLECKKYLEKTYMNKEGWGSCSTPLTVKAMKTILSILD